MRITSDELFYNHASPNWNFENWAAVCVGPLQLFIAQGTAAAPLCCASATILMKGGALHQAAQKKQGSAIELVWSDLRVMLQSIHAHLADLCMQLAAAAA
jgi:hypothetical protein